MASNPEVMFGLKIVHRYADLLPELSIFRLTVGEPETTAVLPLGPAVDVPIVCVAFENLFAVAEGCGGCAASSSQLTSLLASISSRRIDIRWQELWIWWVSSPKQTSATRPGCLDDVSPEIAQLLHLIAVAECTQTKRTT
jgi:hypothetical protein